MEVVAEGLNCLDEVFHIEIDLVLTWIGSHWAPVSEKVRRASSIA